MRISQSVRLSQDVIMTPQLQQAIKLLQLSQADLVAEVQKELLENPVLEEERDFPAEEGLSADPAPQEQPATAEPAPGENATKEEAGVAEMNWDEYFDYTPMRSAVERTPEDERRSVIANITATESLHDHLIEQIHSAQMSDEEERIAQYIILNLDDNGYLQQDAATMAEAIGEPEELVADILTDIQDFDPPGVGARDLKHCLLLQAERLKGAPPLILDVLDQGFEHLQRHRYDLIAKQLKVTVEEVAEAVKWIQSLEPKPGRRFGEDENIYVTPDVYVFKLDGEYVVQLNEDGLPKLRISSYYRQVLTGDGANVDPAMRRYVNEKVRSAQWLIKSIHQRQSTLYKVTSSIVKFQREFLERGVSALKPMILRDVAEDIGMHESTISRVTTAKYVDTPQGIYELKFFFKSHVGGEQGDVSSEAVKDRIRRLIADENPKKPLSDQAIEKVLRAEGIQIARRTVAKYRETMNIPPSALRKRMF